MKTTLMRALLAPVFAVGLTACASTGSQMESPDAIDGVQESTQALIRVQHDAQPRVLDIYFENSTDNAVPLGSIEKGDTKNFVIPVTESYDEYRLVARAPDTLGSPDVILSAPFVAEGEMTVNWYLAENELEVN